MRLFIFQIAEYERTGRASLHACRRYVPILQLFICLPTLPFALADPLHTEGALFHDAFGANGNVGIEILSLLFFEIAFPEIEEPRMVGTVVSAIARANATVVDLNVQPLLVMVRRVYRTHRLAGCVVAMLTEHGQKTRFDVGVFPFPIALDANPINCPLLNHNVFEVERDIVFGMAGDNASLAARAAV